MTPKEKANELVDKYWLMDNLKAMLTKKDSKKCALIAVKFAKENPLNTSGYCKYLDEVEQEIEKL